MLNRAFRTALCAGALLLALCLPASAAQEGDFSVLVEWGGRHLYRRRPPAEGPAVLSCPWWRPLTPGLRPGGYHLGRRHPQCHRGQG